MKQESFDAHPLWSTLDEVTKRARGLKDLDGEDARYARRRIHAAIELVDTQRSADPALLEPGQLDDVNNHLTQVSNHVRSFLEDQEANEQHLAAASEYIPNVATAVRSNFPYLPPDEITSGIKGAATRYKNSLDEEIEQLHSLVARLEGKVSEAESLSNEKASEFTSALEQAQARVDELATTLQTQIDQQEARFSTAVDEREASFAEEARERSEAFAELTTDLESKQQEFSTAQKERAEELIASLRDHESRAASLVDTTSRHAISGDYKTWAARQSRAAMAWTLVTVAVGIGVFGALIYLSNGQQDASLNYTLTKLSITAVGLIVAGYAARQAAEHRKEERAAKKTALDLDAIEPYLLNVDDPNALRTELARRVFFLSLKTPQKPDVASVFGATPCRWLR